MNNIISLKARQTQKIAEIGEALRGAGMFTLAAQAKVLGLRRSTVHTIVKAQHKSTGISGRILARMLRSPQLPTPARVVIEEYVREKMSGAYGNNERQRRRFMARLEA